MTDQTANKPVVVSANQGIVDSLMAGARYVAVIATALIAIVGFLKAHDVAGLSAYIQANGGDLLTAISGLIAVATAAYGIYKTHKRGAQMATVAADPKVPQSVAQIGK